MEIKVESRPTVWDIQPYFGSYLNDMETCLKGSQESWSHYLKNQFGHIVDLLGDFGQGDWSMEQIEQAVEDWLGHR